MCFRSDEQAYKLNPNGDAPRVTVTRAAGRLWLITAGGSIVACDPAHISVICSNGDPRLIGTSIINIGNAGFVVNASVHEIVTALVESRCLEAEGKP